MDRPDTITGILLECVSVHLGLEKMTLMGMQYQVGQIIAVNGTRYTILGANNKVDSLSGMWETELTLLPSDDPE